jgi:hypothetical protein
MARGAIIDVRMAKNSDGNKIKDLARDNDFDGLDHLDWSDIEPYWLVAWQHGEIVGAVEVLPGKPVGRVEYLSVDQTLSKIQAARILQKLLIQAMATLKVSACQAMMGIVPFSNKGLKRIYKNRGGWVCATGNMLVKRII